MKLQREDLIRFVGDVDITLSVTPQVKAFVKQLIDKNPEFTGLPVKAATLLFLTKRLNEITPSLLDLE